MKLRELSINTIRDQIASREIKAVEICRAALERIERLSQLNAFITVTSERALAQAEEIDRAAEKGDPLPPLAGAIVAIKDNMVIRGVRTTAGSRILFNYKPPYTATAVERLEAAGAIIIGKTNCDEFAMGSSNENSAYEPVKNPWDTARVPGGSSGGSAVAVASGMATAALGSDTGGSIRQPASFCGVVGVLPTYGRVSRYGLVAFASSLDHIGPFSRTVQDSATLLQVVAGRDPADSTSAEAPVSDYAKELDGDVKGLRLGVPKEYFGEGLDAEVGEKVEQGLQRLRTLGCEVEEISLPHTEYAVAAYYLICTAEASANLARYDGVRYTLRSGDSETLSDMYQNTRGDGFGAEVKRRIILGTYVLSAGYYDAYYRKAQKVRALIASDFAKAFAKVDAIVTPVSPFPAFKLGAKMADPLEMYLSDIYTITASLAGITGISVPCGKSSDGLPIGMQILTSHFEEGRMLKLADAFEKAGGFAG